MVAPGKKLINITCKAGLCQGYKYIVFLSILLMNGPFIHASNTAEPYAEIAFDQDTLSVRNGTIASLTLKIQNNLVSLQNTFVKIETDTRMKLFSKNKIYPLPQQGHFLYVPVSIYIPEGIESGRLYPVTATLQKEDGEILKQVVCLIRVIPVRKVKLDLPISTIILRGEDQRLDIPIHLINTGNKSQSVSVIIQPSYLRYNESWNVILKAHLSPFGDTIIHFNKKIPRSFHKKNMQQIDVTGLYPNGDLFGRASVNISSPTSVRNYRQLSISDNGSSADNGKITLTGQYLFTPSESSHLTANGNVLLQAGRVRYQLDLTKWKNSNTPFVRNTYLSYEHIPAQQSANHWGITLGNISRNYEQNITGRGISAFLENPSGKNRIEAGMVQENYSLFSALKEDGSWRPATSFWASSQLVQKNIQWNSVLLHKKIPYEQRGSSVWSNDLIYRIDQKNKLTVTLNAGNSRATSGSTSSRTGVAGGVEFAGKVGPFSLNSNNFISTAYYPGLRQGAFSMQQRLSHALGKGGKFWLTFNAYNYNPEQLPGARTGFISHYGSAQATTGISFRGEKGSLSFQPNWSREKSDLYSIYSPGTPSVLQSWDLNTTVSYSGPLQQQQLSVSATAGFLGPVPMSGIQPFHFRTRANWNFHAFNLMASWQSGYFYLGEMSPGITGIPDRTYDYLLVAPQLTKRFWRNRITMDTGLSWTRGRKMGSNLMFSFGIRVHLSSRTEIFSDYTRSKYSRGNQVMENLQAGISSVLPPLRLCGPKRYTLKVSLYKDLNRNDIYDNNDPAAGQHSLFIDQIPFTTNAAGVVSYHGLPAGNYCITVLPTDSWYAEKQEVNMTQSMNLEIPLRQAGILKGSIISTDSDTIGFARETVNKYGMQVTATSITGKEYTAQTDQRGSFIFYLPAGIYTVSLLLPSSELQCLNNGQVVRVDPGQPVLLDLKIAFNPRKIEIKRFSDVPL